MIDVQITDTPLHILDCIHAVSDDRCGAVATFTGGVRNTTQNRKVIRLEYECYYAMALNEMEQLAALTIRKFDIQSISMHHRTGILKVGDIAVHIAVSAPHRAAAFAACQFAIDTLKQTVPIWKKEIFEDGEQWISAHA